MNRLRTRAGLAVLLIAAGWLSAAESPGGEEFAGPFPSWRDLKRDYGARGDGQADDTAALQKALDELVKHTQSCVLYVPAGTYRVTATLKTVRQAHTDGMGVTLIGEDPERTLLRWDGPEGGIMLCWDAWYSKISRLTLDGARRARAALRYGPAFSTYNETSDMIFQDAAIGILFGENETQGQAENAVLRCRFRRCTDAGVETCNWNSMDIWVWHSRFEDCGRGLHNVMGNFHAWHNVFTGSRTADISTANLMVFSVVNNTSIGSRCFLNFETGHSWGAPTSITGNRVIDSTGDVPLVLGNAGPYLVMDNVFRLPAGRRAAKMTWGDQSFVGNVYTSADAVVEAGRFRRVAERVADAGTIDVRLPALPATPVRRERRVIDVAAGADGDAIQKAIDQAAALTGQSPIVHLPAGTYRVKRTLVIPVGCDVQVVGDGAAETATRLEWHGPEGGPLLRVLGPGRARLRDFYVHAPGAQGIVAEGLDRPGGRVFAEQLNVSGTTGGPNAAALHVAQLAQTDVQLRCLQGSGNAGAWVEVRGPADSGTPGGAQVSIFNGATGSAAGQYRVRDGGWLVVRGVYHEKSADALRGLHLADRGTLAIDATRFSYKTSPQAPLASIENFRGLFTLATGMLLPVDSTAICRFEITGDGRGASALALNNMFWAAEPGFSSEAIWSNRATPPAGGGLIGCNVNSGTEGVTRNGFASLADVPAGGLDDAVLLRHLAPLREARVWEPADVPAGSTDLRIHRVMVNSAGVRFAR